MIHSHSASLSLFLSFSLFYFLSLSLSLSLCPPHAYTRAHFLILILSPSLSLSLSLFAVVDAGFNEYVVFNPAQIRLRYLVLLKTSRFVPLSDAKINALPIYAEKANVN